ncbi:uncharacterized protein LOC134611585 [Pelobates fuscus]|uniref:uncharacterized protein LOC134611585 n=1 Tax=Pelobates fuscus TaxID=191477 RepID=UPI002FE4C069
MGSYISEPSIDDLQQSSTERARRYSPEDFTIHTTSQSHKSDHFTNSNLKLDRETYFCDEEFKNEKNEAAKVIQTMWRSYRTRRRGSQKYEATLVIKTNWKPDITPKTEVIQNQAATIIQASYKGYKTRKIIKRTEPSEHTTVQTTQLNQSAIVIQSHYRGYRTRQSLQIKKTSHLEQSNKNEDFTRRHAQTPSDSVSTSDNSSSREISPQCSMIAVSCESTKTGHSHGKHFQIIHSGNKCISPGGGRGINEFPSSVLSNSQIHNTKLCINSEKTQDYVLETTGVESVHACTPDEASYSREDTETDQYYKMKLFLDDQNVHRPVYKVPILLFDLKSDNLENECLCGFDISPEKLREKVKVISKKQRHLFCPRCHVCVYCGCKSCVKEKQSNCGTCYHFTKHSDHEPHHDCTCTNNIYKHNTLSQSIPVKKELMRSCPESVNDEIIFKTRQLCAATAIQSHWRGFQVRQTLKRHHNAALKIQSSFRGYKTRQNLTTAKVCYNDDNMKEKINRYNW